jgi:hypothetical protein
LFQGRSPQVLHDFLRAYVRYETRVTAYLFLVADPFPAFGSSGSYPVDLSVAEPVEQDRWQVGFRVFLAVPALILAGALGSALFAAGVLGWFTGLFRSEMPVGLRNLAAYALRYAAQTNAYFYLLTPHYPDSAILRRPG